MIQRRQRMRRKDPVQREAPGAALVPEVERGKALDWVRASAVEQEGARTDPETACRVHGSFAK